MLWLEVTLVSICTLPTGLLQRVTHCSWCPVETAGASTAVHLVSGAPHRDHAAPINYTHHPLLPVQQRVIFKTALLVWKWVHGVTAAYLYSSSASWFFCFQEDSALVHMHCACNTVQLLRLCQLPFSLTMSPTAPSWTHWLQDLGSHAAAWVRVVSQKDWRNQGATDWILAMHWYSIWVKNAIFMFFGFAR